MLWSGAATAELPWHIVARKKQGTEISYLYLSLDREKAPRGGTGGEVKEWVGGRLKEGEGRGEQGRPSNGK